MNLQVAKWGDSLEATLTVDGGLSIHPRKWSREIFAREREATHEAMPMGTSVVDELRRGERY